MMMNVAFDPATTHVFLVGICDEWDKGRATIGDVGLANSLVHHAGIPRDRVVHLRDDEGSRDCIEEQFVRLLQQTNEGDTLVVYYGGHGQRDYFCTQQKNWRHAELVSTVEKHFRGSKVWMLVDCCYSGNFHQSLQEHPGGLRVSYFCIMSTTPTDIAGDAWMLTRCLVRALEGAHEVDGRGDGCVTVDEMISYMADEHARVKKDLLTIYVCGVGFHPDGPMRLQHPPTHKITSGISKLSLKTQGEDARRKASTSKSGHLRSLESPQIVEDASVSLQQRMSVVDNNSTNANSPTVTDLSSLTPIPPSAPSRWKGIPFCSVGHNVYAKWHGGRPAGPNSRYVAPVWLLGTVTAIRQDDDMVQVELHDAFTSTSWTTTVHKDQLLHELHFRHHFIDPDDCVPPLVTMAKKLKYVTHALAPGTHLLVLWPKDSRLYPATVMALQDYPVSWKRVPKELDRYDEVGPYVCIQWQEEEEHSIVPLGHVVVVPTENVSVEAVRRAAKESAELAARQIMTPRDSLMASLHSAGKSIVSADSIPVTNNEELICFWAGSRKWMTAQAVDFSKIPLQVLAEHFCYRETGDFCIVYWEKDKDISLLPMKYVQMNGC